MSNVVKSYLKKRDTYHCYGFAVAEKSQTTNTVANEPLEKSQTSDEDSDVSSIFYDGQFNLNTFMIL